ncbi:2-succinyl-5-enolpyruvyl-6-hydroxy-3-cyclohexene-1-carboxylate synthase [Vibrio variabilis]|uniref:2-succinyl-5-enolpyruvyl-6-hydroxy-3-cyclohexene-1-carboxylate synthase n=1 Tax=Vibrio variabilis TaxID=990271 RepID=A0ABR4YEG5_9VIBR|nr:2-succinyl-5-enolpyruvyl-6-hydroxy-3-cyclohexene-1-carboxylic-acid synthase [Vibrio variabilis]KHA61315.1 2-succinyl-5-enolpyruvyl-6-hydroxy-3-cyclohexene-1-carboxylate synthase [Vibrio variabilis]
MSHALPCVNQAVVNRIWCRTLLEELTRFGVSDICIAPGSRSTPLTLEADQHSQLFLHTHFDERGLGFLALGLAKASQKPVAIVVTSGTAVANLLPAIAEAKLTGEKLVVLTADRPIELVSCGANQAIQQSGIFSNHVSASLELPSPSLQVPLKWLLTSVDQVMAEQANQGSAIHINCPFPEPLYSDESATLYQDYMDQLGDWWQSGRVFSAKHLTSTKPYIDVGHFIEKKGVVVLGSVTLQQAQKVAQLADKLGWPLLCDPQSGVGSDWSHYDLWLQNHSASHALNECELVLQFGSRIISKRLNHWLTQQVESRGADYHFISPRLDRNNQTHLMQQHHVCEVEEWLESFDERLLPTASTKQGWAHDTKSYAQQISSLAGVHLSTDMSLSEIGLALTLNQLPKQSQLFVGNSLFVRLVDMFSRLDEREVYTNRGASGIDGLIATASGVIRATGKPTVVFIGDTSLLYDVNSLALLTHSTTPVVVVVTNNDGGAIFDLLPVPEQQKQALYQMPHGYNFEYAAKQFQLEYAKPETLPDYLQVVGSHLEQGQGALVVEVQTPPEQASSQLKEFIQQVHAL